MVREYASLQKRRDLVDASPEMSEYCLCADHLLVPTCVVTTRSNLPLFDNSLMIGMTSLPSLTAKLPFGGRKSSCTSTMMSARFGIDDALRWLGPPGSDVNMRLSIYVQKYNLPKTS